MKKPIIVLLLFLLAPSLSFAAGTCGEAGKTGTSPYTADSCSYADVNGCIGAVEAESTVYVPAGTETWGSRLMFSNGVNLIGAGIDTTVITGKIGFDLTVADNEAVRVSGFTFNQNDCDVIIVFQSTEPSAVGNNKLTKLRIDHCKLTGTCTDSTGPLVRMGMGSFGVIDNCQLYTKFYAFRSTYGGYSNDPWTYWAYYPGMQAYDQFGQGDNMYVEDCTFVFSGTGDDVIISSQDSLRWALRYNDFTMNNVSYHFMDMHGNQGGGTSGMYAVQGAEVYGNDFQAGSISGGGFLDNRGGQATVHHNSWSTTGSLPNGIRHRDECADSNNLPATNAISGQSQRPWKCYSWSNRKNYDSTAFGGYASATCAIGCCDGDTPVANTDFWTSTDWVESSAGVGCGSSLPEGNCTEGVGFWLTDQSCSDLSDMVGADPATPIDGSLYVCNDSNEWVEYYIPYTYPHPLRGETQPSISGMTLKKGASFK